VRDWTMLRGLVGSGLQVRRHVTVHVADGDYSICANPLSLRVEEGSKLVGDLRESVATALSPQTKVARAKNEVTLAKYARRQHSIAIIIVFR